MFAVVRAETRAPPLVRPAYFWHHLFMTLIAGINKKRVGRGRPFVGSTALNVRIPPRELEEIDSFIATQPEPRPTRPEAIRILVREALTVRVPTRAAKTRSVDLPVSADFAEIETEIKALEAKAASIPEPTEPSPEAGMNIMKKALIENELAKLKGHRKRLAKTK